MSNSNISLVVMAAGIGSRYGGLKQLDPVGPNGEFIIDYSIYDAIRAGFNKVVLVIRRDIEDLFMEKIGNRIKGHVELVVVRQELGDLPGGFTLPPGREKPWGTGQAVLTCRDVIDGPFSVINADDFYGKTSYEVLADHLSAVDPRSGAYANVGFVLRNTVSEHGHVARGVCEVDEKNFLSSIVEHIHIVKNGAAARSQIEDAWIDLTGDEPVSMNMWGFTPGLFGHLESHFESFLAENIDSEKDEFLVPTLVDGLIRSGDATVTILRSTEKWFGVTYPQDKQVVINNIGTLTTAGVYPAQLWT